MKYHCFSLKDLEIGKSHFIGEMHEEMKQNEGVRKR